LQQKLGDLAVLVNGLFNSKSFAVTGKTVHVILFTCLCCS